MSGCKRLTLFCMHLLGGQIRVFSVIRQTGYKSQSTWTLAEQKGNYINLSARHTNHLTVSCQTPCFIHIHKQYRKSNATCYWKNLWNAHLLNLLPSFTNSWRVAPASSLLHHCKHEFSAHSLSKRPPRAPGQSQYRLSPGWCTDTSPILHESRGSAEQRPMGALWVKGYCWSVRGRSVLKGQKSEATDHQ